MPLINVTKLSHFSGHKDAVYTLCNGVTENEFYSGGGEGYVVVWNHTKNVDGSLLVQVNRPVYSLCLDKNTNRLYCGTASGNLHIIDLKAGKEIRNIEAHSLGVFDIKLLNDKLITCGGDGNINLWSLDDLKLHHVINASDKSARCLILDDNLSLMMVGFSDNKFRVYLTRNFELREEINAHQNSIFSLCFNSHNNELLSGGRDAILKIWLADEHYKLTNDIPAHTLHINHILVNPSGNLFATVSMDKTIKIWDAKTKQLLKVIDKQRNDGHLSSVNKCLWIDDKKLITCSDDKTVMIWQIET